MAAEVKKEIQLEIAHVLFIDIVGYSKLSINEQRAAVDELTKVVRSSDQYQKAEAAGRLIKIPGVACLSMRKTKYRIRVRSLSHEVRQLVAPLFALDHGQRHR